jgi:hypothetical protein
VSEVALLRGGRHAHSADHPMPQSLLVEPDTLPVPASTSKLQEICGRGGAAGSEPTLVWSAMERSEYPGTCRSANFWILPRSPCS